MHCDVNKSLAVERELENVQGRTEPENPHEAALRNLSDSGETPGRMRQLAGERCKGTGCSHVISHGRQSTKENSNCGGNPEAST